MKTKHALCSMMILAGGVLFASPLATPESQGISSRVIQSWIERNEREIDALHGFVLRRHGQVIAEGTWAPFDTLTRPHMLYSHSKSFTSTAIGFLVSEGKIDLDDRVIDFFPDKLPADVSPNLAALRVRDLLTMNTGAPKTDASRGRPDLDWEKQFLANDFADRPGTAFRYDSCATYMLACIVERKTGKKLMDFLDERLFKPIGISSAWSTVSLSGVACGGWGMNMTTRDISRFGQLLLDEGMWDGKRVLSRDWIRLATSFQTFSGKSFEGITGGEWGQGYGFQFWRCRHNCYRADGAFGQYTVVMPDQDAVLSIHSGVPDMQKVLDLIWSDLLPAMQKGPLPEDAAACDSLRAKCASLAIRAPADQLPGIPDGIVGKTYAIAPNARGFETVSLVKGGAGLELVFKARAGESRFPAGKGAWATGSATIDPDPWENIGTCFGVQATAACGWRVTEKEYHVRVYLTDGTFKFDFVFSPEKVSGNFWGMNGCLFEGK